MRGVCYKRRGHAQVRVNTFFTCLRQRRRARSLFANHSRLCARRACVASLRCAVVSTARRCRCHQIWFGYNYTEHAIVHTYTQAHSCTPLRCTTRFTLIGHAADEVASVVSASQSHTCVRQLQLCTVCVCVICYVITCCNYTCRLF